LKWVDWKAELILRLGLVHERKEQNLEIQIQTAVEIGFVCVCICVYQRERERERAPSCCIGRDREKTDSDDAASRTSMKSGIIVVERRATSIEEVSN